jgi:hypothetical protein
MCPYPDCDGDAYMDAFDWESICENNPKYPKIPKRDEVYPMYLEKGVKSE